MINRRRVATGCLMLLWTAVSAQKTETKAQGQPSSQQPQAPAPQQTPPALQAPIQPSPVQPLSFQPPQIQPATVVTTTLSATIPLINPIAPAVPQFGSELRGKIKGDEQHFHEQSVVAKSEFGLRQAEERKGLAATLADKGFWERRRLTQQFHADQAKRRQDFNEEQEKKRRTYEWRYP